MEHSKSSVSVLSRERGFNDQSFYNRRRRLAMNEPVRFTRVEAPEAVSRVPLELIVAPGDRLRVPS